MEKKRQKQEVGGDSSFEQVSKLSNYELVEMRRDAEAELARLIGSGADDSEIREIHQIVYSISNELARRAGELI